MNPTPFRIDVPQTALDDLRSRLINARFASRSGDQAWAAGADPDYLRSLIGYWADGFDWRGREEWLNGYSHHLAEVGGRRLHFVRFDAVRAENAPAPLALLLSHGWPSSFVEMLPLAERLSDPARFGGDPALAFDVIVPSLPGFLYSELTGGPLTRAAMASSFHALMTDVLGYERYGAFGGDIGGVVSGWLGALHPDRVVGIHMIHPPAPASFDDRPLSTSEQAFLDAEEVYDTTDRGYSEMMGTRPDTVSAALIDSPVGLAAWIVDKYRDWSDCHGDVESRFDRDTLLTILTLYWTTESIGTSFRQYLDYPLNEQRPAIGVPAAFTLSAEPGMANFPREIAERACSDIRHWSEPARGGHFLPLEEPDLMADELRGFFGSL